MKENEKDKKGKMNKAMNNYRIRMRNKLKDLKSNTFILGYIKHKIK